MNFDFNSRVRRELGYRLIDVVDDYFSSLPERPVQVAAEKRNYPLRGGALPEIGRDPAEVLDEACRELIDGGFHIPSAHYLGMMNPTPTYTAFLAESLVAALNPQLATVARSRLASSIEAETVRWIGELVGWPGGRFSGTFTTGGNEANFSALALALSFRFPGVIENGMSSLGAQPVFYSSVEGHHSLDKSAGLLGLGRKALRRIAVDRRLQLDVGELEAAINLDLAAGHTPFCVVATAGTTSSGAIDELPRIADLCRRYNLWFHVDGAYGAAVLFSARYRDLVNGIEHADSVTLDPHKWLAMPFSAGLLLTRRIELLSQTFSVPCPYLKTTTSGLPDNLNVSVQWSRRMNSLKLWLTLKVHGRQAYQELIERQIELARGFAEWVSASDRFELAAPQVLPIVNLRLRQPDVSSPELAALHARIIEEVNRDGERWISGAMVNGENVIRTMVISYLTGERHLKELQAALQDAALKILPPTAMRRPETDAWERSSKREMTESERCA